MPRKQPRRQVETRLGRILGANYFQRLPLGSRLAASMLTFKQSNSKLSSCHRVKPVNSTGAWLKHGRWWASPMRSGSLYGGRLLRSAKRKQPLLPLAPACVREPVFLALDSHQHWQLRNMYWQHP